MGSRTRLQLDARHEYRRYKGVAGSDQSVSVETPLRADLEPDLDQPAFPTTTQRRPLIVQEEKIAQISRVGLHRGRSRAASARYHATKTGVGPPGIPPASA